MNGSGITYEDVIAANVRNQKDKEIERLKDLCDKYEEEHKTTFEEWKKAINIIKEVREYIEERYNGEVLTHTFDKDNVGELLNILKGVDKE